MKSPTVFSWLMYIICIYPVCIATYIPVDQPIKLVNGLNLAADKTCGKCKIWLNFDPPIIQSTDYKYSLLVHETIGSFDIVFCLHWQQLFILIQQLQAIECYCPAHYRPLL